MTDADANVTRPQGPAGDPVCWLDRVCDACGAFVEGVDATPCWNCGAVADSGR
ncbi:hypothetical protein [Agromyces protaetiae]|uniref:hypothetical protein n=1 Tax=Agromyces protaetiae TaxID=2509455 RepID=UPI0013ED93D1|nr:hypothetical protein [Agromyces protaetiae]